MISFIRIPSVRVSTYIQCRLLLSTLVKVYSDTIRAEEIEFQYHLARAPLERFEYLRLSTL